MTLIKNGKEVESIIMGGTRFDAISNNVGKHMTYGRNKSFQSLSRMVADNITNPPNGITDTTSIVGYAVINNTKYLIGDTIWSTEGFGALGLIKLSDVTITN